MLKLLGMPFSQIYILTAFDLIKRRKLGVCVLPEVTLNNVVQTISNPKSPLLKIIKRKYYQYLLN